MQHAVPDLIPFGHQVSATLQFEKAYKLRPITCDVKTASAGRVVPRSMADSAGYQSASSSVVSAANSDLSVAIAASERTAKLNAKLQKVQQNNERQATLSPTKDRAPTPGALN